MSEDYEQTISAQAAEIYDLELTIDELKSSHKESMLNLKKSIGLDDIVLKAQEEIAGLSISLFELKDRNKDLVEETEHQKAQIKFLEAELDVACLKRKFKDENDKFEFNVVKLNLLNIIDKLKLQIDHEKLRYEKLRDKLTSEK